jgi:two-component system, chemotaxis family, chemotaxis protein CheY
MGYQVLIVEDSKASREFLAAMVESISGVRVTHAASGFEALKLLPRHRFDLIITDINMPDINGLELINFVKKNPNYRQTPLFVITTEGREKDRERGLALGAAEYLVKPVAPDQLAALLRQYLRIG